MAKKAAPNAMQILMDKLMKKGMPEKLAKKIAQKQMATKGGK